MQQQNEQAPQEPIFDAAATQLPSVAKPKTPIWAYIVCGWPLILVGVGGAIGGGLGGVACVLNLSVFRSQLPVAAKAVLIPVIGMAAVGIWLAIGIVIVLIRGGVTA